MRKINKEVLTWIEDFYRDNEDIEILISKRYKGFEFVAIYENGIFLRDKISESEVETIYNQASEIDKVLIPQYGLWFAIGWRIEQFRNNDYHAEWLEKYHRKVKAFLIKGI